MTDLTIDGIMPRPNVGSTPGPEDIGAVVTVVVHTVAGPNAGNQEMVSGRLVMLAYAPPEVHETHALPPEIAKLTGHSEEENTHKHVDPEQVTFAFEGGGRFHVMMAEHEWSYTVHR